MPAPSTKLLEAQRLAELARRAAARSQGQQTGSDAQSQVSVPHKNDNRMPQSGRPVS